MVGLGTRLGVDRASVYHKRRAFNRDRISLLVDFLLLLEIEMYLLNDTQQPQQLLETAIPNVSCMYLSVARLLKFL